VSRTGRLGTSLCMRRGADWASSPGVEDCADAVVRLGRRPGRARSGVESLGPVPRCAPRSVVGRLRLQTVRPSSHREESTVDVAGRYRVRTKKQ
jgi:hypothetical protein